LNIEINLSTIPMPNGERLRNIVLRGGRFLKKAPQKLLGLA